MNNCDQGRRAVDSQAAALEAFKDGLFGALKAGGVVGLGVICGHHFHKGFRTRVGVSGKTALIVSAALGNFMLNAEHSIISQRRENLKIKSNSA